jgi:hypothetical protein
VRNTLMVAKAALGALEAPSVPTMCLLAQKMTPVWGSGSSALIAMRADDAAISAFTCRARGYLLARQYLAWPAAAGAAWTGGVCQCLDDATSA